MGFHQARHVIACASVVVCVLKFADCSPDEFNNTFVVAQQLGHQAAAVVPARILLGQVGELCDFFQRGGRVVVKLPDSFGYPVDELERLVV